MMSAQRCTALCQQLGLTRLCASMELLLGSAATCSHSRTPAPYASMQDHPPCMAAGMSSYAAYQPPRHNPKTLKRMLLKTERSVNADIAAATDLAGLEQAIRGLEFLAPSTAAVLLARLAFVSNKEQQGSLAPHADMVRMLWAQGIQAADVQLHLIEPRHLCRLLWALSQLQQLSVPEQGLPRHIASQLPPPPQLARVHGLPQRILSILMHDGGALLALAEPQDWAKLATGLKDLQHPNAEHWRVLAKVACSKSSAGMDAASKGEIAQAVAAVLQSHSGDGQLASAVKQLQAS